MSTSRRTVTPTARILSEVGVEALAHLPALVVRRPFEIGLAVDAAAFEGLRRARQARCWSRPAGTAIGGSDAYYHDHPFLTAAAAELAGREGAALVGIDSHNIDDTRVRSRPVHTVLLGAGIPICEHMTGLGSLPDEGFRFSAVPPKVAGMGTFPVRAYAVLG